MWPQIVCADFRDFLATQAANSVDLLLSDPPYAISKATGFSQIKRGVKRFAVSMDFGAWDTQTIDVQALATASYRVLRKGGTAIIFYDIWKITPLSEALRGAGFEMIRLIIWEKTNPVPLNSRCTYLSNSREVAVVGVKVGRPTFHSQYDTGIYKYPIPRHQGQRIHPTQKPLDLFIALIKKHSNEGDLVVDPFLGGGTAAVAAYLSGRHFKGCDIDAQYVAGAQTFVRRHIVAPV